MLGVGNVVEELLHSHTSCPLSIKVEHSPVKGKRQRQWERGYVSNALYFPNTECSLENTNTPVLVQYRKKNLEKDITIYTGIYQHFLCEMVIYKVFQ